MSKKAPLFSAIGLAALFAICKCSGAQAQTTITQVPCNYQVAGSPVKNSCSGTDFTGAGGGGPFLPTGGGTVTGNLAVGGTLSVTGATSLTTLTTSGAASVASLTVVGALTGASGSFTSLTDSGALTAGASTLASASVTGNETVGGTLNVTGALTDGSGYVINPSTSQYIYDAGSGGVGLRYGPTGSPVYAVFPGTGGLSIYGGPFTAGSGVFSGTGSFTNSLAITGANGTTRPLLYQTAGANRWEWYESSTSETGSNVGSDLGLGRFNDSGVYIDSPFIISRNTGLVSVYDGLNSAGQIIPYLNPLTGWAMSFRNNAFGINNATFGCLSSGGGLILVHQSVTGDLALYLAAAGTTTLISTTQGTFINGNSAGGSGKIGFQYVSAYSAYCFSNNYGQAITVTAMLLDVRGGN